MSTPYGQTWPTSFTYDGTFTSSGATVAANSTTTSSTVIENSGASPNEVLDTEVTFAITYGSSVSGGGVTLYACRRTLSGFQSPGVDPCVAITDSNPIASSTRNITFMLRGYDIPDFELACNNPSGNSSVTVKAGYRQSQGLSG